MTCRDGMRRDLSQGKSWVSRLVEMRRKSEDGVITIGELETAAGASVRSRSCESFSEIELMLGRLRMGL